MMCRRSVFILNYHILLVRFRLLRNIFNMTFVGYQLKQFKIMVKVEMRSKIEIKECEVESLYICFPVHMDNKAIENNIHI